MINYDKPHQIHAYDAKYEAQKISLAPIAFQAARCLIKFGILKYIDAGNKAGVTLKTLTEKCSISEYGVHVLVDMGLSMRLVWQKGDRYILDKTGHFLLHDTMAIRNLNFVHDVCYKGLFELEASIKNGKPEGLKEFGDWPTIYNGLSKLPEEAHDSWFEFDHFYSDHAFPQSLPLVFEHRPNHILDIGGNTGKWAVKCAEYDENVEVTIMDLPGQLDAAKENIAQTGLMNRIHFLEANFLKSGTRFFDGADTLWMSQFLDCFSQDEILSILKQATQVMNKDSRLFILETFWDRQRYEAGSYCVNATSLYFTCMANGNSRMYHSKDMVRLIHKAGMYVEQDIDNLGVAHTLLHCRLRPAD